MLDSVWCVCDKTGFLLRRYYVNGEKRGIVVKHRRAARPTEKTTITKTDSGIINEK